ncbi:hypothetical protein AGOR_G00196330 [Albula goreensis]|uniref:Uncharacterized protein n=1 Tax=Albula goreensis TaxID=1534307 RepID=A0A8T3CV53_9TELE|nr:hypothetical protein AGOR_G00196330 [Albula goreensis]
MPAAVQRVSGMQDGSAANVKGTAGEAGLQRPGGPAEPGFGEPETMKQKREALADIPELICSAVATLPSRFAAASRLHNALRPLCFGCSQTNVCIYCKCKFY